MAAAEQPEASPTRQVWTRATCATWIAAVDRMQRRRPRPAHRRPRVTGSENRWPPAVRPHQIAALRTFFRDCQEWEWLPAPVRPANAHWPPRAASLPCIGPNPRVIADDIWAKLLWAGLNLTADRPPGRPRPDRSTRSSWSARSPSPGCSPASAATRSPGCVSAASAGRHDAAGIDRADSPRRSSPQDAVCLLDVPTHKTGTAFTKPVDPILGQAIDAWQARPPDPAALRRPPDRRAGRPAVRGPWHGGSRRPTSTTPSSRCSAARPVSRPPTSAGNITSHRARSTIASQLYNAKEPMTLFELQAWLGHRSPQSTQHYAKISPEHPGPGLHRRRLLRPQRPHHRGPHRP